MITIITDNHKKINSFYKKPKRNLINRYFTIVIYYQLDSADLSKKNYFEILTQEKQSFVFF